MQLWLYSKWLKYRTYVIVAAVALVVGAILL